MHTSQTMYIEKTIKFETVCITKWLFITKIFVFLIKKENTLSIIVTKLDVVMNVYLAKYRYQKYNVSNTWNFQNEVDIQNNFDYFEKVCFGLMFFGLMLFKVLNVSVMLPCSSLYKHSWVGWRTKIIVFIQIALLR